MPNDSDFFGFDDADFNSINSDSTGTSDGFNMEDISSAMNQNPVDQVSNNDFDEYGNTDTSSNIQTADTSLDDKSMIIKQAGIIIAVGILIVAVAFMVVKPKSNKNKNQDNNTNQQVQMREPSQSIQSKQNSWVSFEDTNISFSDEQIQSIFTITSIAHYAKIVDTNNNLMVKTVLTGSLSGYIGTYELEVPYSKGSQLKEGNYFDVWVRVGDYNGKKVVGEISY